ncbi:hypothetical protein Ahy_B08g093165 isoform B [Arachis hypogaea]|uniref:Uncharacterized protein n=1 Tax=Arachis hypogaea TaxID=3818 RepID=A0A444Y5L3_ARAHY|nr:hypothetical protein Ahy_B08g093165 isoform A [Arachis hypogaea]RYQ97156.1 hypothetical protein Ahy_B08g093165 isoform B [Arachis hypogaea]
MQAWKKRIISFMLPSDLNTCLGWKTARFLCIIQVKKWTSNYNNYAIGSHVMDSMVTIAPRAGRELGYVRVKIDPIKFNEGMLTYGFFA